MSLRIAPATISQANAFVAAHHRHHRPTVSGLFAVAVVDETSAVRGVAIVGRPVARRLSDGLTVEVNRVATDGARNACSMLLGACWRAARALGWQRMLTYTMTREGGASLRGAGWRPVATTEPRAWGGKTPAGEDRANDWPIEPRVRWEVTTASAAAPPPIWPPAPESPQGELAL